MARRNLTAVLKAIATRRNATRSTTVPREFRELAEEGKARRCPLRHSRFDYR